MTKRLRSFTSRRPVLTLVLLALIWLLMVSVGSISAALLGVRWEYAVQLAGELLGAVLIVGYCLLAGITPFWKNWKKGFFEGCGSGSFLLVLSLFALVGNLYLVQMNSPGSPLQAPGLIVIFVVTMFFIGFNEEFLFRGIANELLKLRFGGTPGQVRLRVLLSGLLFGLCHISNLFGGVQLSSALVQALLACVLGMLLMGIYLRSGNIWCNVLLHALIDFSSLAASGLYTGETITSQINQYGYEKGIAALVYLIPLLIILRRRKLTGIVARETAAEESGS